MRATHKLPESVLGGLRFMSFLSPRPLPILECAVQHSCYGTIQPRLEHLLNCDVGNSLHQFSLYFARL